MKILGIHDGHCSSASIMIDGKLQALVAEERFTRLKNDHGYPLQAIEYCLAACGLTPEDIDVVAFATEHYNVFSQKIKALSTFKNEDWLKIHKRYWKPKLYEGVEDTSVFEEYWSDERFNNLAHHYDYSEFDGTYHDMGNRDKVRAMRIDGVRRHLGIAPEKIKFFDHHACHAYYAFYGSPIRDDNTLIYTLDGGGDATTSALFQYKAGKINELARSNTVDIARIYRSITLMMGMKQGEHEYKVMGLAPYATKREINKSFDVFKDLFLIKDDLIQYKGDRPKDLYFHFRDAFEAHRFDGVGAAVQKMVEQTVMDWIETSQKKYHSKTAVFSGGVAMNVKLNRLISQSPTIDNFYVCPSPSDDTLCVGACYMAESEALTKPEELLPVTTPYLGPSYTNKEIREAIEEATLGEGYTIFDEVSVEQLADWLVEGKTMARFCGKMEYGQRALGNRSILANPTDDAVVEKINQQVKYRDFWMPFAPVVLSEREKEYFQVENENVKNPYMMLAAETTEVGRHAIPAGLHRGDATARPQVLERKHNEKYYDLIKTFESKTGVGALLNTSFNLHGEPIVCSPKDAISTFMRCQLDVLVMENVAILRN